MNRRRIPPLLAGYINVVKGLGTILGRDCEVLLHDVSHPESSIIACENGHVSGRAVGSPMTDFGLIMLKDPEYQKMNGVYNYLAKTEDGKILKCGVCFIKDDAGKIIGFLCINMDVTKAHAAKELLDEFFKVDTELSMSPDVYKERFSRELDDVVSASLSAAREKHGDLASLSRRDKLAVIGELDSSGYFLVKGAIERLALEMGKSKFTIYAYLRSVHEAKDDSSAKRCEPI